MIGNILRNVEVTRERVLGLIKTASVSLTTKEMGRILKVKERSARAAVTWLVLGGFIIKDGCIESQTTPGRYGKRKFKIQVYKWTGKTTEICKVHTKDFVDVSVEKKSHNGDVLLLQKLINGMKRN